MDSAPQGAEVQRLDFGTLGNVERTHQGGLRVDAALTRAGVFTYFDHNGREIREWRPPEEVFHQDSLASLADAPVTDTHPPVMVDTSNFREFNRGHVVHGTIRQDQMRVASKLVLQDATLIAAVEKKDKREISCGYRCRIEEKSGVTPEGERFDRIQRGIRYNHVAVVQHGRAGEDVALRLDSAGNHVVPGTTKNGERPREEIRMKPFIRIDGVDYPLTTEAEIQAATNAYSRYQSKLDGIVSDLTKDRDSHQGRADAAEGEVKTLKTALAEAQDPKRLDARVRDRSELVTKAAAILGPDVKLDGLSDDEIRKLALAKARPEQKFDGKSPEYIQGVFTGLETPASAGTRTDNADPDGLAALQRGTNPNPDPKNRTDSVDPTDSAAARKRMDQANRTAWTQPLAYSKDQPRG